MRTALALAMVAGCLGHDGLPINPALGVPGFPDCVNPSLAKKSPLEKAIHELACSQKGTDGQIKIGTVGDSITAGVHVRFSPVLLPLPAPCLAPSTPDNG